MRAALVYPQVMLLVSRQIKLILAVVVLIVSIGFPFVSHFAPFLYSCEQFALGPFGRAYGFAHPHD